MQRSSPNILITGTPGTGKSSLCAQLAEANDKLKHLDVSEFVQTNKLYTEFDPKFQSYIIDEDKLCDELEDTMSKGGVILDTHSLIDYFPERWFDLVVVLRTENTILFDRLVKRGYSKEKVTENVECEIMQVILEDARQSYDNEIVQELTSNTVENVDDNVARINLWYKNWLANNS